MIEFKDAELDWHIGFHSYGEDCEDMDYAREQLYAQMMGWV